MSKKTILISLEDCLVQNHASLETLQFYPEVIFYLRKIITELGYDLALLPSTLKPQIQGFVQRTFENESIHFKTAEAKQATVIGTSASAKEFASKNEFDFIEFSKSWKDIYQQLVGSARKVKHSRITKETSIEIELNPDGEGKAEISTGLHFFDHMLEQIARHGGLDLKIKAKGDLHIDEHHTVEDTAITLGETFLLALGDKRGIERYGFCLPMDDALAQVAIDFGGRNWIVWEAEFKREKVGDVPTELFFHFFKSFSDAAKCNLNIKVEGENEHHKIEAIFKAFAKAIKMAVKRDLNNLQLPSTKGLL